MKEAKANKSENFSSEQKLSTFEETAPYVFNRNSIIRSYRIREEVACAVQALFLARFAAANVAARLT
jgi:hypothetical protein